MLNNKRIEVLISTKNRNIDGIPIDPGLDALLEYMHDSTKIGDAAAATGNGNRHTGLDAMGKVSG